jgi:DNA-binding PucR family transcriptional regulator
MGPHFPQSYVPWNTSFMTADLPSPRTAELMAQIADRLLAEVEAIGHEMDQAEAGLVPVLAADPAIAVEVSASNRANLRRWLTVVRHPGTPPAGVPPEALDIARTFVRRGLGPDVIFEAYRRGQQVAWQRWMRCASSVVPPGPELIDVLETSLAVLGGYVDEVLKHVLAEAQREREEVLGGTLARHIETVRLILDGAPIHPQTAGPRLGYDLTRKHTALVLWTDAPATEQGGLESAAVLLARAAGAGQPLTLLASAATLWAWIGSAHEPAIEDLRAAIRHAGAEVRAAAGTTQHGVAGFRRSHEEALAVHRVLAGHAGGDRLVSYRELSVTTLAAQDRRRAAQFVAATLGPLAADEPNAARLRETLRVFLDEAENAPRAAVRLHTHRNTVHQRIARASQLLGRQPGEDRLALELALELARRLGPQVLLRTTGS